MAVNIVLVEPEIPQNTGNIIRTCACTNAVLHLVKPLGFSMDEKHMKRAGLDYIDLVKINIYENFAEFEEKNPNGKYFLFSTKSQKNHFDVSYEDNCYLIFGKETKGLSKNILEKYPENMIRIPMVNEDRIRSLNLSNSVAIGVYEALRQLGPSGMR